MLLRTKDMDLKLSSLPPEVQKRINDMIEKEQNDIIEAVTRAVVRITIEIMKEESK